MSSSVFAQTALPLEKASAGTLKEQGDLGGSLAVAISSRESVEELKHGLAIESVAKNSDAEKMGFVPGDVILSWVRGEHHGLIESPFDLLELEIEELPHGAVTLEGLTGTTGKSWVWPSPNSTVQEGTWGLVVRPNVTGSLLTGHQAGQAAAVAGKSAEATEHWQATARDAENQHLPHWLAGWLWLRLAESLAASKERAAADRACQQAVELVKEDSSLSAKLLRACGDMFRQQHADELAKRYYTQALANLQDSKPMSLSMASVLTALGRMAYNHDEVAQGVVLVGRALQIQERLVPASLIVASNLNRIGVFLQSTGNLDQSEKYLLHAVALRENLSPRSTVLATTLQNLGDTLNMRGDPDKAEPYLLRALKLWEELRPGSNDLAGCFVDIANSADDRGDWAKAEEYERRALDIQRRLQPRGRGTAVSLNNLGLLMHERGQLAASEKLLKESLEIKEELDSGSLDVASTLVNLGDLMAERDDLMQAEKYLREALAILQKKNPKGENLGGAYAGLGDVAWKRKDFPQAERYYREALAILEATTPNARETGDDLQRLGDAARKRGETAEAETNYLRALKIRENTGRSSYADTLLALAEVALDKQQWDIAAHRFEQGLEALERQTARSGGGQEIRSGFRTRFDAYYRDYVDLLMVQKQPEIAFQVLERSRARSLLEMLAEAQVNIHQGVDPVLLERERTLQGAIAAKTNRRLSLLTEEHRDDQVAVVTKEIGELVSKYQEVEGQIRISSPGYAALTQPQPLNAKEIQERLLDADTVLLEYSLGEKRSYVFAVTKNAVAAYELPKRAEIEAAARHAYDLLTAPNSRIKGESYAERQARVVQTGTEYWRVAGQLSRMILGPVAGLLRDPSPTVRGERRSKNKRLVIVSDGALHYVPFAALPLPHELTVPLLTVPLMVRHEVISLPSASVLAVLRQEAVGRKSPERAIAVLADPVFDRRDMRVQSGAMPPKDEKEQLQANRGAQGQEEDVDTTLAADRLTRSVSDLAILRLPRLPKTREEARSILATIPPGQGMLAVDFKASRVTATGRGLAQFRIVHFATHGLLNSKHPELSGLVLSLVNEKGVAQNGFLGLQDIYNLNLPVDLVVLSACETGLGKNIQGEGMVGLTRGFMYAGATRVVASLWQVNDQATAELMARFYKSMEGQGMRPAAALRAAQIGMWRQKRRSSPYYWAAFQIQGEWK